MSQRLEDLIAKTSEDLSRDLAPVKRLRSPMATAGLLALVSVAISFVLLALSTGLRQDAGALAREWTYIFNDIGMIALLAASALGIAEARVPGSPRRGLIASGIMLAIVTAGLLVMALTGESPGAISTLIVGQHCSEHVMLLAVPALGVGIWLIRRGAPISFVRAAITLSGFGVATGALILPFACRYGDPMHLMLSHLWAPGLLVLIVSFLLSRPVFRW